MCIRDRSNIVALDGITGDVLWRSVAEEIAYGSPIQAEIHGKRQLIVRAWARVLGLDPQTGDTLWEEPTRGGSYTRDCATPIVVDDIVYTTNEFHGTMAIRITPSSEGWQVDRLWRSGGLAGGTATPIYHAGYLYGLHREGLSLIHISEPTRPY